MMDDETTDVGTAQVIPAALPSPAESLTLRQQADQVAEEFSLFYRENMPWLVRYLVLDGAPLSLAAEIAQEAMLGLWRSWTAIHSSPKAWVRTAASRAWIRYRTSLPELPVEILPEPNVLLRVDETEIIHARRDLLGLLEGLGGRQRQVMALFYDGDTPGEIATELGITEATVRSTLRNARKVMQENHPDRKEGQR
jgi:RNA polymerase sigma factor (sigma-70 family)